MLSGRQRAELDQWSRTHPQAGMRLKALAIRAVALGHTRRQVGAILQVSPYTVGQWCRAYQQGGGSALQIHPGRGRRSRVDARQVEEYVRQSPRNFGVGLVGKATLMEVTRRCGVAGSTHGNTPAGPAWA